MRPHRQTTGTRLSRALGLFKDPPKEVIDSARARIARTLELTIQKTMEDGHPDRLIEAPVKPVQQGVWRRPMVRAAAVLALSVLLLAGGWLGWGWLESRVALVPAAPGIQKEVSVESEPAPRAPAVSNEARASIEPRRPLPSGQNHEPAPTIVSDSNSEAARENRGATSARESRENQGATANALVSPLSAELPLLPQPTSSMAELCAIHELVAEATVDSLMPPTKTFIASITNTDVVWRLTSVLKGSEKTGADLVTLVGTGTVQRLSLMPGQRYLLFMNSAGPGSRRYFLDAMVAIDDGKIAPENRYFGYFTPALQARISAMTPDQVRAEVRANSRVRQVGVQVGPQSNALLMNSLRHSSASRLVFTADSTLAPGAQSTATLPLDGQIENVLLEVGTYRVSIEGLPFGYEPQAAIFDRADRLTSPMDLQRDRLRIDSRRDQVDLVVFLLPDPAAQGVTVRGRVNGLPAGTPSPVWVSLQSDGSGASRAGIAAVGADGRFEFSSVPPGRYFARVSQSSLKAGDGWAASTATVVVGNSDTSVELPLAVRGVPVNVKVSVAGQDGRSVSFLPDNFMVTFARASLMVDRASGEVLLSATLAPGDYIVALGPLSAGFTLKSIRSGVDDLTVRSLSVGNAAVLPFGNAVVAPVAPVEVVLQYAY